MNQDVTTAFVSTVLNNVFAPYYEEVRRLEARAADKAYRTLVPPKMRKRMNKLPDRYFTCTDFMRFQLVPGARTGVDHGTVYRLRMSKPAKLPEFIAHHTVAVVGGKAIKRRVAKFAVIDEAYYNDRVRLQLQLRNLCAQCQSNRALIKAWPEAEGHIAGTATAPQGAGIMQHVQELHMQITRACKDASQKQETTR